MVVNKGGNLSVAYFTAYLNLIIQAHQCSVVCAQQYMMEKFFKGNLDYFGPVSYQAFSQAFTELQNKNK